MLDPDLRLSPPRPAALIAVLALIALGTLAESARSQKLRTSPPGFLSVEGSGMAALFGRYKESRVLFLDGEVRGAAMTLRSVAVRPDYHWTTGPNIVGKTWNSEGRTWSRVTLTMSECSLTQASATFSRNALTTPTTVFDARVSWPTISGTPTTRPVPWGHTSGRLRFPFLGPWNYSGRRDLCLDFVFTGGTLANRGAWRGRDEAYVLDSFVSGPSAYSATLGKQFGTSLGAGGCIDNHNTSRFGGIGYPALTVHAMTHRNPVLRGKLEVGSVARETAPSKPLIHGLSVAGHAAGFPVPGVTCNRLHLLAPTSLFFGGMANATGWSYTLHALLNYVPAMAGVQIWGQSAWADTASGKLQLTSAFRSEVPQMPRGYQRLSVISPDASAVSGSLPDAGQVSNPVFRYTH